MMIRSTETELLSQNILEFYNTHNEARRRDLQNALDRFQEESESWRIAVDLINPIQPTIVQFYGAKVLCHSITRHFDQIAESIDNISILKNFYVQILSDRAHSLPHSVLNKLSSGLAILVLKSLPDIWPHPFRDLVLLWSNQLELLLRIFAEIAAEFCRLNVSLNQRNGVKAKLQSTEIDVIQIAQHVLEDVESSASLRNAAVECVELWLKLPNAKLDNFMAVFSAIFANLGNDFPALARILCTIKSNEEFENLPKLIWQITQFIAYDVCPRVQEELNSLASQGRAQLLEGMDELVPLISVLVEFCHDFVRHIVKHVCTQFAEDGVAGVYISLCQFFFQVSNLPGTYPSEECISDLPEPWWCSLREELLQPDNGSEWSANKQRLRVETTKWYLEMLQSLIGKLAHSPQITQLLDKESLERFEAYRVARSDVSLNAIQLSPDETVKLLAANLNTSLDSYDPDRSEVILYLFKEAADFINESHISLVLPVLQKSGPLQHWLSQVPLARLSHFARALLELFKAIEHLFHTSPGARAVLPQLVQTTLSCLQLTADGVDQLALDTLIATLKHKDTSLKKSGVVLDTIIQKCYDHFSQEQLTQKSRLLAIRCVGIGLSFKQPEFVLSSLNQILAPRLAELDKLASSTVSEQQEDKILFELGVLAQLVATLESGQQHRTFNNNNIQQQQHDSPVRLVIDQTFPLINKLLANHTPTAKLIAKLCEVLKASVQSLYTQVASILDTILNFIDTVIDAHPRSACELAKSIFLTFHKDRTEVPKLMAHLARWYSHRWSHLQQEGTATTAAADGQQIDSSEKDEQLLALSYHVLRKFWDNMLHATTVGPQSASDVHNFIQCQCLIISLVLRHSRNIGLLQEALRILNFLLKQNACTDNAVLSTAVGSVADRLASAVFASIQSELITSSVNLVADVLHHLASKYPALTRTTVAAMPEGDSPLVISMFADQNVKNFRLRCAQMHQASLLQRVYPNA